MDYAALRSGTTMHHSLLLKYFILNLKTTLQNLQFVLYIYKIYYISLATQYIAWFWGCEYTLLYIWCFNYQV